LTPGTDDNLNELKTTTKRAISHMNNENRSFDEYKEMKDLKRGMMHNAGFSIIWDIVVQYNFYIVDIH